MRVSGFTFVRNAIRYDYPVVESIRSVLPLCDEIIVAVGNSEDSTRELVESIDSPKIRIIDTIWDDSIREGGQVLAIETNKALAAISAGSTWAIYIQADEILHEKSVDAIRYAMTHYKDQPEVEGLLCNYLHFYGSYDYVGNSREWYRKEVRVIRPDPLVSSWKDAQGFRKAGIKLRVKPTDAWIYHYGWVKPPSFQQAKQITFHQYWHTDQWILKNIKKTGEFDYPTRYSLQKFQGDHPAVMSRRIEKQNWVFQPPSGFRFTDLRLYLLHAIEQWIGWRIGEYRNYRLF